LKPANIFFDKKKQKIKLGDFGLATTMEESLFEKGTIGTPLYRAPEGYVGTSKYAEKVDIYSLGIILFELYYNKNYKT
jgi:serine/threonine protein kinase